MRLGVLTGGGDAPGLNAAIRGVARRALAEGWDVVGVYNGWGGLVGDGDTRSMELPQVSGILPLGGTMLGTSRVNPLRDERLLRQVEANLTRTGVDYLVAIGGNDTLSVASALARRGVPVAGVPKTMDNDLQVTEYCIGFDSAVAVVTEALDRLHTTAASHHRLMVVEVMGRDTGWVALMGGLAGGADMILIPEHPISDTEVVEHLKRRRALGKDFSIVVVAEGFDLSGMGLEAAQAGPLDEFGHPRLGLQGAAELVASRLSALTEFETRVTVLGYTQRGGSPTAYDRIWATAVGSQAFELARQGRSGLMPAKIGDSVTPVPLEEAVASPKVVPEEWYRLAQAYY